MSIVAVLVAVVLAFLAFRFVTGVIKFGVIALILVAGWWFVTHGGAA